MSVRTHYKLIGAAGAAALAIGTVAGPAVAADPTTYSCFNNLIAPVSVHFAVDTPSATTLVAGQKLTPASTATVTLTIGATHLMHLQGWDHFTATVTGPSPSDTLGWNMSVPMTAVPPEGTPAVADASGTAVMRYGTAGAKTLQAGDFTAVLTGFTSGTAGSPTPISCVAPTDGSTVLKDSSAQPLGITVTKDTSKTAASASYNAKKNIATGVAKVKAGHFGLKPTGKVTFVLKRGTHKIGKLTGKLNKKGIATVHFKNVKKLGKYSISEKYSGNGGLKSSTAKAVFRVKS
jgi:hypothetical protein